MAAYSRRSAAASKRNLEEIAQAQKELSRFLRTIEEIPSEIIIEETARAKREMLMLVPERSRKLRRSIRCEPSRSRINPGFYAYASAVNRGYNYAYDQHENPDFKHAPGKEYKFIEKPFLAAVERIERRIEEALDIDK